MQFLFKYLERINRMNDPITMKATGNPDVFSQRLNISKRQLYNDLGCYERSEQKSNMTSIEAATIMGIAIDIEVNINR